MKEIEKAIDYLKSVSIREVGLIRIEEIRHNCIVLSYEERKEFIYPTERIYKKFNFKKGNIRSMEIFKP